MNTSHPFRKTIVYGALGLLWLITVLIGYYYTHKPFSTDEMISLLIAAWRVLVVFGIISLAGGIGFKILKGCTDQPLSKTITQVALGLGILSVITLALGATLGFNLWIIASILILSGFLLFNNILDWLRSWIALKEAWNQSGRFGKTIAVFGIFILTCSFIVSLAPPLEFDTLTYHLAIPRAYLIEGRVTYLPDNMFWGMPEETEMLHTLAMLFGGNEAATLLGWSIGFLTLAGIFSYTKERLGYHAAWAAFACLLVGETLSASIAWGYVEWPSMFFATAMIIAMDEWLGNMEPKSIVLAGIFAGMTLATKYTAGILLLGGMIVILSKFKSLPWRTTLITLLLFGFSAVLVFSPWLAKNALATGNPVYPLLYPSGAMDQIRLDFYQKNSVARPWLEMLLLPWQATVWGLDGKIGYSASIGPLLLGLSLMCGAGWRERTKSEKTAILSAAFITGMGLIVWAIASQLVGLLNQSRLYFSFFPAWAILGGAGFTAFSRLKIKGIRFGRIASALILLVFGFAIFETGLKAQSQAATDVMFGLRSENEYITDHLGWYAPAMQAIQALPAGTRVLMLWETRSLYCLPKCDPDEVIDRWYHDVRTYESADRILASWQKQGFTHLLLNLDGANFFRENETWDTNEEWVQLKRLLDKLPPPTNFGESYSLYYLGTP
ncbi:MAG: hypothetical protein A2X25_09190 [Chloroflexi bacterium GWB2_49_20]|nr:MAG: hypothetical protein A2X25_09190 [Chloroflexi bacterium GWB2_49_20]OGN79397.1 MAG: hypothetical protein A2X26_04835 [Chloroflexi bacterium GWC2_49_37]OGN82833.1 MAG: hypothetical protein A2X27_07860 [Chloroflexi bacterium GWD2_49_16]HCC78481.1 hypothetical protein [Anaerolineae bacterium]HCM97308.1 hypothetical protein [Anaerolineae bacterium]